MAEASIFPDIMGYRIEKKLGRGGMAEVFLGIQETLGRRVAVKILNPLMVKNRQLLQRFINEAKTASRLAHPNIITVHDVGQVNDVCYIVMEYLQESLVDRIRFSPELRLNKKEALQIVRQIAKALAYAHSEGFIHRDIKPDNILFRKDNTAVLGDFGIARAMDSESQLTTVGMIIGTPHYMSPEQCRGEKIDGQSDIYSLGVVFYEMLTGRIPYKADSAAGVLVKHIQEPVPRLPAELSRFQPLLDSMMAKDKAHRIHTADELLKVLDSYLPESPLDSIEAAHPERYVFNTSTTPTTPTTPTPAPLFKETATHPTDMQPTILSPTPGIPRLKSVIITLALLFAFIAGGYWVYQHWFAGKENNAIEKKEATQASTNIEISEREPQIPKTTDKNTDKNSEPVKPDYTTTEKKTSPTGEQQYNTLLAMAKEYFNDGDMNKATEKLNEAIAIKTTPETQAMQKRIDDFLQAEHDRLYRNNLDRANAALKNGDIPNARKFALLAQREKDTTEIITFLRLLERTELATREKNRKTKLDDDAYHVARSSNAILSFEKYLKQYPQGIHATEAQAKLDELRGVTAMEIKVKDDVAFETATQNNSIAAYQKYLQDFPVGRHAQEAQSRLDTLQTKLLKETKDRLLVKRIRFFEGEAKAPRLEQRQYNTKFPRTTTRYIHVEIEYENKLYRVADSTAGLVIDFAGPIQPQIKANIETSKSVASGSYSRGIGWIDAGKWPIGSYTVIVSIEGQKAGQANFDIY